MISKYAQNNLATFEMVRCSFVYKHLPQKDPIRRAKAPLCAEHKYPMSGCDSMIEMLYSKGEEIHSEWDSWVK